MNTNEESNSTNEKNRNINKEISSLYKQRQSMIEDISTLLISIDDKKITDILRTFSKVTGLNRKIYKLKDEKKKIPKGINE